MSVIDELEEARGDLETLLADVLRSVFAEEADVLPEGIEAPGADADGEGLPAAALLAIVDETDSTRLGVRVRVPGRLAHVLAARMLACDDPTSEDLLDAVGELGNIAGGNVKALLFGSARLSLPAAAVGASADVLPAAAGDSAPTTIRALVLGDVAELTLIPHVEDGGLFWPPTLRSEVLEGQP